MDFRHYPSLDREEFVEVCHRLDRRYRQAALGPIRPRWKLRVCTALDTSFAADAEYSTYIQVIRPLDAVLDHGDISAQVDELSFRERDEPLIEMDQAMVDAEESDEAAVRRLPSIPDVGQVTYEIHYHPTYRMPCLWFALHGLPNDEPAFNIDTVFRRLVPDQFKDGLRRVGPIGGISADHNPVTGVPSFFVHPCLLGDAMSGFACSKETYLMVWLGLVGGCVGLWIPKEMAPQPSDTTNI